MAKIRRMSNAVVRQDEIIHERANTNLEDSCIITGGIKYDAEDNYIRNKVHHSYFAYEGK